MCLSESGCGADDDRSVAAEVDRQNLHDCMRVALVGHRAAFPEKRVRFPPPALLICSVTSRIRTCSARAGGAASLRPPLRGALHSGDGLLEASVLRVREVRDDSGDRPLAASNAEDITVDVVVLAQPRDLRDD